MTPTTSKTADLIARLDHPIIFSAPMVRALLDGRKTMTRRLAWAEGFQRHVSTSKRKGKFARCDKDAAGAIPCIFPSPWQKVKPGDRLWVRENFAITRSTESYETGGDCCDFEWDRDYGDPRPHLNGSARFGLKSSLWYGADGEDKNPTELYPCTGLDGKLMHSAEIPWRPSIHMPRWASRLTLTVTATKIERLQDISEADAKAEGAPWYVGGHGIISDAEYAADPGYQPSKRAGFEDLWFSLHGPDSWRANPEVVALTFAVHAKNIDAMERAA